MPDAPPPEPSAGGPHPAEPPKETDAPDAPDAPRDMLAHMFTMQAALNAYTMERNGCPSLAQIRGDRRLAETWVQNYLLALRQEVGEAMDCTNWKWWRSHVDTFDGQKLAVELVDVLHFWISACQAAGLDAEDVYRIYRQKNEVNRQRQDTGYRERVEGDDAHIE